MRLAFMHNYISFADELDTIRDMLRFFCTTFNQTNVYYGHGTDNAWDEALSLIFDTLGLSHEAYETFLDAKLTGTEKKLLLDHLQARVVLRKPTAYLTHAAWFAKMPFYVDENVIIPRSPIGELILASFSPWVNPDKITTILDLCTGSGCIAIATAMYMPQATVDAIDISEAALRVAAINVDKYQLNESVHLIQSNLFEKLTAKRYDLIVSNPPYVDARDMLALPTEFKHEPRLALAAGNDGLEIVDIILHQAADYLTEHGILIVEVGNSQTALIEKYPQVPFVWLEFENGGEGVFLLTKEQLLTVLP